MKAQLTLQKEEQGCCLSKSKLVEISLGTLHRQPMTRQTLDYRQANIETSKTAKETNEQTDIGLDRQVYV